MYYVIYLWRWGAGGQGGHNLHMGSRLHPMNVNSTKPPENTKKLNMVKWVTRHVLHSCSDLSCFGVLGFLYGFVLLWGSPLVCLVFVVFFMVFTSLAFAALCYHVLGKGKGLGAGAGHRYARQPIYSYGWLREGAPSEGSIRRARWFKSSFQNHCVLY